ncbi:hypothetical protein ONZ45_g3750 [Pleurotus djamor]|nr:hypothetical protein ONZ45_g3750 [Pleurotus djamor]
MSLGEAEAKFPESGANGIPPSPTRENPGQVFPKSDPSPAPEDESPAVDNATTASSGNSLAIKSALVKLDNAIGEVIELLQKENVNGGAAQGNEFLQNLRSWKLEVERNTVQQSGHVDSPGDDVPPKCDGPLFTD